MDVTFKKKKEVLEGEVALKSRDLEDSHEGFKGEIEDCTFEDKFITISPECVRCNLCVEECPVNAVSDSTSSRPARILENCVKCEICAQTCPVKCIHVIESTSAVQDDVTFHLKDVEVPHRKLRMESIKVNPDNCDSCATCVKFCPTGAIAVPEGEIAQIDTDACVGCGACANVCPHGSIDLVRELGPVMKTKKLLVDQDTCVQCQVCEENCPVDAIKIDGDRVVLDQEKCILCEVCSTKCPVGALKLEMV
ncbi:ferredoxin [Methanobacterium sp. MZ-A1]|uniref:Ferredoxin n=1 Tax=Methanobacterium subterraneum TaxID=59277 RepID=A0A2H4VEG5_9EURY|nr:MULTISPECIES: 4Fe-4S binding protein [Methanobacterium]AUB56489.1 ferredoxin [Methanobacterium subterraneum]AUB58641.1 ferredoxin [Methanobacterium sp. MZ-A1]MBW4257331.1 4Fe-4S binding protein [Methanobacterium sp. YSL]PKL71142.1 MAG: ferredoxin [Methanobacteriales archaeon HGW-Methanobacteriales-2]